MSHMAAELWWSELTNEADRAIILDALREAEGIEEVLEPQTDSSGYEIYTDTDGLPDGERWR